MSDPGSKNTLVNQASTRLGMVFTDPTSTTYNTADIISIYNEGQCIVRLMHDGTVQWENGNIQTNAAAAAFGQAMRYGAADALGVTEVVREELRIQGWNEAFDHLTGIANENAHLSADDLTYERECCTLVGKLKHKEA